MSIVDELDSPKGWRGRSFLNILNICNVAAKWPSAVSEARGGTLTLSVRHCGPITRYRCVLARPFSYVITKPQFLCAFRELIAKKPRPSPNPYSDNPAVTVLQGRILDFNLWLNTSLSCSKRCCVWERHTSTFAFQRRKSSRWKCVRRTRSLMLGPSVARADGLS